MIRSIRLHYKGKFMNNWYIRRGREEEVREFKEIVIEIFPNLERDLDIKVYETNGMHFYLNAKRFSLRHNVRKLSEINDRKRQSMD